MFLPLTILVHSMLSIYQTTQFNNDVYHNGLCDTAKNILWRTPKWALLWSSIFVCFWPKNTHSSSFFTLNLNLFLWYSLCASFKTKIMVVLTIFILKREKNNLFSMVLASPIFTLTSKCLWFDLEFEFKVKSWNLLDFIQKPDFWQM